MLSILDRSYISFHFEILNDALLFPPIHSLPSHCPPCHPLPESPPKLPPSTFMLLSLISERARNVASVRAHLLCRKVSPMKRMKAVGMRRYVPHPLFKLGTNNVRLLSVLKQPTAEVLYLQLLRLAQGHPRWEACEHHGATVLSRSSLHLPCQCRQEPEDSKP